MAIKHRLLVEISAKDGRALTYDRLPQGVWRERSRGDARPMRSERIRTGSGPWQQHRQTKMFFMNRTNRLLTCYLWATDFRMS